MLSTNFIETFEINKPKANFSDKQAENGMTLENIALGNWVVNSVFHENYGQIGRLFYLDSNHVEPNDEEFEDVGFFNLDTACGKLIFNLDQQFTDSSYFQDSLFNSLIEAVCSSEETSAEISLRIFQLYIGMDCSVIVNTITQGGEITAIFVHSNY